MQIQYVPGTVMPYSMLKGPAFELFAPMLKSAGGLSLSQVCSVTGLEGSTVQNWVKRGLVAKPVEKKYYERQLARILLINSLKSSMQLENIAKLLGYLNGLVEDTSDDIISEAQLYDYLCNIISNTDFYNGILRDTVKEAVQREIKDYTGPFDDSKHKLYKGLCLMVVAFMSGQLKSEADMLYNELLG